MDQSAKNNCISDKISEYIQQLSKTSPYMEGILNSVRQGETEVSFIRQEVNKHIQLEWIEAIECALVALDNVIRSPSRYIEERDEVKPIELSHNIRPRSLIHLAQHTNYISEVKGDTITPNRILNIYNEETMFTYENRFVNTLVHRLFTFVNSRYMEMVSKGMENGSVLNIKTAFNDAQFKGKVDLSISVSEATDNADNFADQSLKRAGQLNSVITSYVNSEFIKSMGDSFVRPPIMRTNALLKNKNLKICLDLWQFIESYDKVGYTISIARKALSPDKELINRLYDDLALQYVTFKHDIAEGADIVTPIDEDEMVMEPLVNAEFEEIDPHAFDLYQSEYRKIAPIHYVEGKKERTPEDSYIEALVAKAFSADKNYRKKFAKRLELFDETRKKLKRVCEWEKEQARLERLRKLAEETQPDPKQEFTKIKMRYDRSFQARLIQSDDNIKDYYNQLKNRLLSYENTRSRVSWHYENIYTLKNNIAKFRIRGKSLYLFLQLEPDDFADSKYKVELADGKIYATTPCQYKVNNNRRCKLALELIDLMCLAIKLPLGEEKDENFVMPYSTTEFLIRRGLIKDLENPLSEEELKAAQEEDLDDFDDENSQDTSSEETEEVEETEESSETKQDISENSDDVNSSSEETPQETEESSEVALTSEEPDEEQEKAEETPENSEEPDDVVEETSEEPDDVVEETSEEPDEEQEKAEETPENSEELDEILEETPENSEEPDDVVEETSEEPDEKPESSSRNYSRGIGTYVPPSKRYKRGGKGGNKKSGYVSKGKKSVVRNRKSNN